MTRSALITGVGRRRGIGAGIAAGLAADAWDLALSYWRPYDERLHMESDTDDPDHLATELRALGSKVELLPANLEESSAAETLVDAAVEMLGPLDALVMSHCEGVNSGILDTSVESFDRALRGQRTRFLAVDRSVRAAAAKQWRRRHRSDQRSHCRQPPLWRDQGRSRPPGAGRCT